MDSDLTLPHPPPTPGDTTRRTSEVLPLPAGAGAPASRIGAYRVLRELGRGGMGVVHLAEHVALRRQVALKVLSAAGDAEAIERFLLEARAAARLKHPNVVGVHEVGRDGPRWFLAMDLVDGESLRERVQRDGPLAPDEAAALLEPIARALHAAHGLGLLHRDVKPHNVLVARDGTPSLADFGLAKDVNAEGITVTGDVLGTPAYMAPEQAAGDRARVDRRTDVYALGATLYETLTGRPPFQGPNVVNVLRQVLEDAPVPPSRAAAVDRDLETIVLRCLEKDPQRRYDTAQALADDLGRWRRREPILARRAGLAERAALLARRRPYLAAAVSVTTVTALAAGLVSGAAWLEWRRSVAVARAAAESSRRDALAAEDPNDPRAARRFTAAATAYEAARVWETLAPGEPEARRLVGEAAVAYADAARAMELFPVAAEAYEVALARLADDGQLLGAASCCRSLAEASVAMQRTDMTGAMHQIEAAIRVRPDWPEPWVKRAEYLASYFRFAEASADLERAVAVSGGDSRLYRRRGITYLMGGDEARAIDAFTEAITRTPDDASAWASRGLARRRAGDLRGALDDYTRAMELGASEPAFLIERGELRAACGDVDGALADIEEAVARLPRNPRAWTTLGLLLVERGRLEEAAAAFDQAVAVDPTHADALLQRSILRARATDVGAALSAMDEAIRLRPDDASLHSDRAELRIAAGQLQAAIADLDRALALGGDVPVIALTRRAEARRLMGDLSAAAADASAALALDADCADAWVVRGLVRANQGRAQEAIADLERFLELAPDHPRAAKVRQGVATLRGR